MTNLNVYQKTVDPRGSQQVWMMIRLASARGREPTPQKADFFPLRRRKSLKKERRFASASGSGTLSASSTHVQSNFSFRACARPIATAPATPIFAGLRMTVTLSGKITVERPVRREIVDDDDRVGWAGLTLQPCERLLNKVGLVMGMDVGQNAHCLPWSDVETPSEIYRCAWVLDDRSTGMRPATAYSKAAASAPVR